MADALILFAHGARDPEWAAPLRRVRDAVLALQPGLRVDLAFLELMPPTLADCVAALVGDGVERIVVLPMFIAQGGHLKRDVPALIGDLRERFPGTDISLAAAIGEDDTVIRAMAAAAVALLR